jgi:hypothetical protein
MSQYHLWIQSHGRVQTRMNAMGLQRSNENLNISELIIKWRCNWRDVQMKLAHPDPISQLYLAMGILLKTHNQ